MSGTDHLALLRKRIAQAPKEPGVYRWKDADGVVLYVGKAKVLRDRLRSYVAKTPDKSQGPWKLSMLQQIRDVEFTVVSTELEALVLETNLIKQLRPKYNVLMKDDKNYVYIRVGVHEHYPTVSVLRQMQDDKAKYFGPFTSAWECRQALDVFHLVCPFRACRESLRQLNKAMGDELWAVRTNGKQSHSPQPIAQSSLRACLEYQIGRCCGLCVGAVSQEEYRSRIDKLMSFLRGDRSWAVKELEKRMAEAAVAKKYESAAKIRDHLRLLKVLEEDQIVSDTSGEDLDIIGVAVLSGRAHVVILLERGGKVIGERSFALQGRADGEGDVLEQFLPQYYSETQDLPQAVIVGDEFPSRDALAALLTQTKDAKVEIRIPERGKKSHLQQLAEKNAKEKARQHDISWEAEARNVQGGLEGLQVALKLEKPPHRIEGYDISHLGGTQTVGSMVVLKDGKPSNDHYRHFIIRTLKKGDIDDYASMKEVLTRRLRHLAPNAEEKKWADAGVTVGKAKKAEEQAIEEILARRPEDLSSKDVHYQQFVVVRKDGNIVALARLREHEGGVKELGSVWVQEDLRGARLGHLLARKILGSLKKGKVYVRVKHDLEEYYAALGFRHVLKSPPFFQKAWERARKENPDAVERLVMVYDTLEHKVDVSLKAMPDLLLIDGGKGQLAVVVDVLKKFGLQIPVAGLAKREEEVFVPGNMSPVPLAADSPSVLLLRRLRDEAHRFANRLREMRLSKDLKLQFEVALEQESNGDKSDNGDKSVI